MFEILREIIWIVYKVVTMRYEDAVVIVLTALAIMLAGIGLMIAIVAIWGYAEMKKFLQSAAERHVKDAMDRKLAEYPTPDEMIERLRSQIVTDGDTKTVATASNNAVQEGTPVAPPYPEGEAINAHDGQSGHPNARPDNREIPEKGSS